MRVYALLCGAVLSVGYGYAAQVAVSSAYPGRPAAPTTSAAAPAPVPVAVPEAAYHKVWLGGTLAPVVIEAMQPRTQCITVAATAPAPAPVRSRDAAS